MEYKFLLGGKDYEWGWFVYAYKPGLKDFETEVDYYTQRESISVQEITDINYKQQWGDVYSREETKHLSHSYEEWCKEGTNHSKNDLGNGYFQYNRDMVKMGWSLTFNNLIEFITFCEDHEAMIVPSDNLWSDGSHITMLVIEEDND